jgi:hypothetical protein
MTVTYAQISTDGTNVSFNTLEDEVYRIDMDGRHLKKLATGAVGPHWSPDGNMLVMTSYIPGKVGSERKSVQLQVLDLRTGQLSTVVGSEGMIGAFWVTQDVLVAGSEDKTRFRLFSFKTKLWRELTSGWFVNWLLPLIVNIFIARLAARSQRSCEFAFPTITLRPWPT